MIPIVQTKLCNTLRTSINSGPDPSRVKPTLKMYKLRYPLNLERVPPTGQYNCHGLTFANRRARITEDEDLESIRHDDGYRPVPPEEVVQGDIAVYYEDSMISHTAIVLELDWVGQTFVPLVISKWGDASEYIHKVNQSPYGSNIEYWTERTNESR